MTWHAQHGMTCHGAMPCHEMLWLGIPWNTVHCRPVPSALPPIAIGIVGHCCPFLTSTEGNGLQGRTANDELTKASMKYVGVMTPFKGMRVYQRAAMGMPGSTEQLDEMKEKVGSYEALFSRRAMKYRAMGLHEMTMGEKAYRKFILQEYTFLKRPVIWIDEEIFVGNSKKVVAAAKEKLGV